MSNSCNSPGSLFAVCTYINVCISIYACTGVIGLRLANICMSESAQVLYLS